MLALALFAGPKSFASDHADPAWLPNKQQEANLTGLFFFPAGDRYVAILDTRPTLTAAPPYKLKPYTFVIDIDTHSAVRFPRSATEPGTTCPTVAELQADLQAPLAAPAAPAGPVMPATPAKVSNPAKMATAPLSAADQMLYGDCARYGGTVVDPTGIGPDVSLTFALENDATLSPEGLSIKGLNQVPFYIFSDRSLANLRSDPGKYKDAILIYTGVRDDPFIFPKFFNANIVTIVVSIPKTAFATSSQDWLLWGVSKRTKGGKKLDHVGRSNRTQLGRFDVLNTQEPRRHVKVLRDVTATRVKVQDFLKEVLRPLSNLNQLSGFVMRGYDYAPDVMIFTTRHPPGFPNGRRLEDDVAKITCDNGDCPLQENSYIDSKAFPRATKNDKAFLPDFPYLAEPWPWRPQPFTGSAWHYFRTHLFWPLVLIATVLLALSVWRRRVCARLRATTSQ